MQTPWMETHAHSYLPKGSHSSSIADEHCVYDSLPSPSEKLEAGFKRGTWKLSFHTHKLSTVLIQEQGKHSSLPFHVLIAALPRGAQANKSCLKLDFELFY